MTTTIGRTPRTGRDYIALHTRLLTDNDVLDLSLAARWAYVSLLLWTAEQGRGGYVPSHPRHVNRVAELDSTTAAAEAVQELVAAGFLEDDGEEDGMLYVRTWEKYQPRMASERAVSEKRSRGQLRRYHEAGNHANAPAEGCDLCEATQAPVKPVEPAPVPPASEEVLFDREPEPQPEPEPELTQKDVNSKLWGACDDIITGAQDSGIEDAQTYSVIADQVVPEFLKKWGHVPRVTTNTLENLVLDHAARTLLTRDGITPTTGTTRLLHRARKDRGFPAVVEILATASTKRDPVAYFQSVVNAK